MDTIKTPLAPAVAGAIHVNTSNATRAQATRAMEALKHFLPPLQAAVIRQLCRGEEKQFFFDKLCELAGIVQTMPETYGQEGKGDQRVAYLRYFAGGRAAWYITEKDKGNEDTPEQIQAYGIADLYGDGGQFGYINLPEIFSARGEIDLYYTPTTIGELRAKRERQQSAAPAPAEAAAVAEFNTAGPLVETWDIPEARYDTGDRAWLPCTDAFRQEMLEVLPPVYGPEGAAAYGLVFAVSEAWKHTRSGGELLLWFRRLPAPACRIATREEIDAEIQGAK